VCAASRWRHHTTMHVVQPSVQQKERRGLHACHTFANAVHVLTCRAADTASRFARFAGLNWKHDHQHFCMSGTLQTVQVAVL
jgi:hypothetical protein